MTKKEEIYALIRSKKRVSGAEIRRIFGNGGNINHVIQNLTYTKKVHKEKCECGNTDFYEIRK